MDDYIIINILNIIFLDLLESLTDWVLQHADICRPQDVSSLFYSLAVLNYPTTKSDAIKTKLVAALDEQDFTKPLDWLNNVWALVVLNLAEHKHIASVLRFVFFFLYFRATLSRKD